MDKASTRLKGILKELHDGGDVEELKQKFDKLIQDVGATQLAAVEKEVINDGVEEQEVKRLCDMHVEIMKSSLQEIPEVNMPAGHPLHTMQAENAALKELANELKKMLDMLREDETAFAGMQQQIAGVFEKLSDIELHYLRKENQLFPYLEAKGVTGPPQVMWGLHDDVRAYFKVFAKMLLEGNVKGVLGAGTSALQVIQNMFFKEDHILFPMAIDLLEDKDWLEIRRGDHEIGYALVEPGNDWPDAALVAKYPEEKTVSEGAIPLDVGELTRKEINLILKMLPVDISYVDAEDKVRYYTGSEDRIFPRSPGVIGRDVANCHPPKSVATVQRILESFRDGSKDVAEFWLELGGKFLHIRYFAIRDEQKVYQGCLEVMQDVTGIRALEGSRTLLNWE